MTQTVMQLAATTNQLLVADRCDACGAQAFVLATFVSGPLYFCGHHFARWENEVIKQAYEIVDSRDQINAKPSQSSV